MRRLPLADSVLVLCVCLLGMLLARPGVFSVDESHYLLAGDAMASRGSFTIRNGYEQVQHPSLLYFYTVVPDRVDELGTVSTVPPYQAVLAAPFVWIAGVRGFVLLNLLAFGLCLVAVRRIARRIRPEAWFGWGAVALFGLGSYSLEYALGIWPHAVSQALVAWALLSLLAAPDARPGRQALLAAAAGLLAGIATGVRIQNIVLLAVFLVTGPVWLGLRWRTMLAHLGGWMLPLLGHATINWHRLGDPNPFSYGQASSWENSLPVRASVLLLDHPWLPLLAAAAVAIVMIACPAKRRRWAWAALACATLALLLILPATRSILQGWLSSIGFHLVDTSLVPGGRGSTGAHLNQLGQVLYGGVLKKSLLEAVPWAALVLTGLAASRLAPRPGRQTMFLTAAAIGMLLGLPLVLTRGGLCFNPRYLLEALPALSVVAMLWMSRLGFSRIGWLGGALIGLGCALPYLLEPGRVQAPSGGLAFLLLPLLLAGMLLLGTLLALAGPARTRRASGHAARWLAAAAVVFALAVHLRVDLATSLRIRHVAARMAEEAAAVVPGGTGEQAVLGAWEARKDVFTPLKLDHDLWIAGLDRRFTRLPAFMHEVACTRRVYVLRNGIPDDLFRAWVTPFHAKIQERAGLVFVELRPREEPN